MINDFLFHKVSDKEKKEIKKQAKRIMDIFSLKLSKVGKVSESLIEREQDERKEGEEKGSEIDRKIMFSNAPEKKDDFIIAEKGEWK